MSFRTCLATLQILCFVFISVKEKGEMYERNDEEERGIYVVKCERNPKAKNKTIKTTKLKLWFHIIFFISRLFLPLTKE